jgi:hypothetical protein
VIAYADVLGPRGLAWYEEVVRRAVVDLELRAVVRLTADDTAAVDRARPAIWTVD